MEFKIIIFNLTYLHYACLSDNVDVVKYLLSLNEIPLNAMDKILKFLFLWHLNIFFNGISKN